MTNPEPASTLIRLLPRQGVVHVSRGRTALCIGTDGTIDPSNESQGLYVFQTRMLSQYKWLLEGKQPSLSTCSQVRQHTWLGYYYAAPPNAKETPAHESNPLQETIELRISRVVGGGLHEDAHLVNHTQITTSVSLELEVDADFASRSELKSGRKQHGILKKNWTANADSWHLEFDYRATHEYDHQGNQGVASLHRKITLTLEADSEPSYQDGKISFSVQLPPHGKWQACLKWNVEVDGLELPLENECDALVDAHGEWSKRSALFLREAADIRTLPSNNLAPTVQLALSRAREDLAALRLFDLDEGEHNWKIAAGIPTYLALFGRDLLAAAWQASLLSTDMSVGGLSILKTTQSTDTNPWRDAQPGRMIHEAHTDPLSVLNFSPKALYYGAESTSLLYPIIVSEVWHWIGKKEVIQPFIKPALDALAWADKYSRDENGFYKYKTNSEQGIKNQGWKDSSDAIVHADGSQAEDPIGTCEIQGFAYAAKVHFSEVLWWFGEEETAARLYKEAQEIKKRFNERFWMEDEGFIAMALDGKNQLARSIASDPGHCLTAGVLDDSIVKRVANRLLQPDLFSGWGIRTLSSNHPAYNPFSYHRGSVWPVENGGFVLGMARYGLHGEMWKLAQAMFEAASLFDYHRLPEVFGGHQRDSQHPFPGLYEKADFPQAWSASAPFAAMQGMLGIYPYAPLNTLFLDPWLPEWLPDVTVEDLKIGDALATIKFHRENDGRTEYSVERLEGTLHILRQPSPNSLTAGWGERIKDSIMSLLPVK